MSQIAKRPMTETEDASSQLYSLSKKPAYAISG